MKSDRYILLILKMNPLKCSKYLRLKRNRISLTRNKEFGLVVSCPTNLLCDFQKIIHHFSP